MIAHDDVQLKLYEFLQNEIAPEERALIEAHLATCNDCANELQELRDALALLPIPESPPSSDRSEEFWSAFSSRVVEMANTERRSRLADVVDWLREAFLLRPGYAYALSGAFTLGLAAIAFWTFSSPDKHELLLSGKSVPFTHTATPASSHQNDGAVSSERVSQYFRKSKTLLVGLANLRPEESEPLDFSTERRVSRSHPRSTISQATTNRPTVEAIDERSGENPD